MFDRVRLKTICEILRIHPKTAEKWTSLSFFAIETGKRGVTRYFSFEDAIRFGVIRDLTDAGIDAWRFNHWIRLAEFSTDQHPRQYFACSDVALGVGNLRRWDAAVLAGEQLLEFINSGDRRLVNVVDVSAIVAELAENWPADPWRLTEGR